MACLLDNHPLIDEINDALRGGSTYGEIRAHCLSNEERIPSHPQISRHGKNCLGLAPRTKKPEPVAEIDVEETPEISQVRDDVLKEFYKRLKNRPKDVDTRDLVSVLNKILQLESGRREKDPMDELITQINEQDSR